MDYTYSDLASPPCERMLYETVLDSAMADKSITGTNYTGGTLTVTFTGTLSGADKTILDGLVTACLGKKIERKTRGAILVEICEAADATAMDRINAAYNAYPAIIFALDMFNYTASRGFVADAFGDSIITSDDRDLMLSKIPDGRYCDA